LACRYLITRHPSSYYHLPSLFVLFYNPYASSLTHPQCTDCNFDGREENDTFFGFDPIDHEGIDAPPAT
jgi:hypothetical protein